MEENMAGKKKEAKSDDEDSSIRLSIDETNGQISIQSNPSPGHHAQTPAENTSSAANDERLLPWHTAEEERFSKEHLYLFAIWDKWDKAKSIFDEDPNMVRTPLTDSGDRALHIAAGADSTDFVQGLVNLVHMNPQDLEIRNSARNTAFCVAAISGNAKLLRIMMDKNKSLPLISGQDGMLPVHLAASSGHDGIVDLLSSDDLLGKMEHNDIERLFLMTISSGIFGVAIKLFENETYGDLLAIARSADEELTALHILARKPSPNFYSFYSPEIMLFEEVWSRVSKLEHKMMLGLITKPSTVLFDAIESGNDLAARVILGTNPELLTLLKDSHGRSPLHCAVSYRREGVLRYILRQRTVNLIIRAVDNERNNVLHLAASYQSDEALSRVDTKMQRELAWFKEVEERVPPDLRTMKNSEGKTPRGLFDDSHTELYTVVKQTVKGIAKSGMLVAALIANVAFAAALTGPGDKTSAGFVVFILTNTAALFASSASIISFLSIFTSAWVREKEFIISQTLITLGLVLLVISVVSMVLSFAAASFLIFGHVFKWVAYVVVSVGVLPILFLLVLRSKYVGRLHICFRYFLAAFQFCFVRCGDLLWSCLERIMLKE